MYQISDLNKRKALFLAMSIIIIAGIFILSRRNDPNIMLDIIQNSFELNLETILYDKYDNPVKLESISDRLIFVFNYSLCASCVIGELDEIRRFSNELDKLDIVLIGYFNSRRSLRRFIMRHSLPGVAYYRANDRILTDEIYKISSMSYFLKIRDGRIVLLKESTDRQNETYNFLKEYFDSQSIEYSNETNIKQYDT